MSAAVAGPDILVREADGSDLDEVVAVGRAALPIAHADSAEPELIELYLAKWWTKAANVAAIRSGRALVAEVDGEVVGMASHGLHDGHLVLWKLYVLPQRQHLGIGGRLLEAVCERMRDAHDVLWMAYSEGNESARLFTARHGFVEDHREEQGAMPTLVWTRRELHAGPPGPGSPPQTPVPFVENGPARPQEDRP